MHYDVCFSIFTYGVKFMPLSKLATSSSMYSLVHFLISADSHAYMHVCYVKCGLERIMIHLYPRDITRLIRTMETLLLLLFGIYINHRYYTRGIGNAILNF